MTETDLCNMALSHIGEGLITSLDDDNETARICNQYYQVDIDTHIYIQSTLYESIELYKILKYGMDCIRVTV